MIHDELSVLSAFLAVAEERSFTRAAKRLGVSASALSHAIRGLEERIGVRLLARTTRSVAPTAAGEQLVASLRPALAEIGGTLERISGLRARPAGTLRLLMPRTGAVVALAPKDELFEKMLSNMEAVKARGGVLTALTTEGNDELDGVADHVLKVPEASEFAAPIVLTVPLQLLAYHIALLRGCDVDQPRNLAKSVTVE